MRGFQVGTSANEGYRCSIRYIYCKTSWIDNTDNNLGGFGFGVGRGFSILENRVGSRFIELRYNYTWDNPFGSTGNGRSDFMKEV